MSFNVRSLAAQKQIETHHDEVEWMKVLESARQSLKFIDIDYFSLEQIALASRSPSQFTVICRLIYQYGKSYADGDRVSDVIFEATNDSSFSLSDWIDAIEYLYEWLGKQGRKIDFFSMLNYLKCCVASSDAQGRGQTLFSLVQDMLQIHGFDA